jgi:hypothetical protein
MPLTAPPEDIYPDVKTAFDSIQAHAKGEGYAFKRHQNKPTRRVFTCDRAGDYDPRGKGPNTHPSKQRGNSGTKKCGCLMQVELRLDKLSNTWALKVLESAHNHAPSLDYTAHPAHRLASLPEGAHVLINTLSRAGSGPNEILNALRCVDPEVSLISKDISNLTQKLRIEELDGKTPIQWLLEVRYTLKFTR